MLLASERRERDSRVDNAKSGICYMYGLYVCPVNARVGNFFLKKKHGFLGLTTVYS